MSNFLSSVDTSRSRKTEARFPQTNWEIVSEACLGTTSSLETLAEKYWPAVYAFLRRNGFRPEEAQDVTQNTFARLLGQGRMPSVDPGKGRFRSFLCACARNEASHFRQNMAAKKRGGTPAGVSALSSEDLNFESAASESDCQFDRDWSKQLITSALEQLRREYDQQSKASLYHALLPSLISLERGDHQRLSSQLGISENHSRVSLARFRKDFVRILKREVRRTVADPQDVDAELSYLMRVWAGSTS